MYIMNNEKFVVVEIPDGSLRIGVNESIETSPPLVEPVQEPEPIPSVVEVKYNKNMRIAFEVIFLISIYNLVIFSRIIDIINLVFIILKYNCNSF